MSFILTLLILGSVLWHHVRSKPLRELLEALPEHIDLALDDLNYTHTEDGRKRWTLKADRAEYLREGSLVNLTDVDLLFFEAGAAGDVTLRGDRGQLHEESRRMDVYGNVIVTTQRNEILKTEALHYDDALQQLQTTEPFSYISPRMTLDGVGLKLDLRHNTLMVHRDVVVRLLPNKEKTSEN